MSDDVNIRYANYGCNDIIMDIASFELITDVIFTMTNDADNNTLVLSMKDKISDNVELEGAVDYDNLNTLIKLLSQFRNQIKQNIAEGGVRDGVKNS